MFKKKLVLGNGKYNNNILLKDPSDGNYIIQIKGYKPETNEYMVRDDIYRMTLSEALHEFQGRRRPLHGPRRHR